MTVSAGFQYRFIVRYIILLTVFIAGAGFSPPAEKRLALLLAEYDTQAAQNHRQHLWRFTFGDATVPLKEKVLTVEAQKPGESAAWIRMDVGTNTVYRNRWVVTGIGNIIDLQQKKVVSETKDRFVKASGDSLIFYTNDIFKGKYYSVFDTRTGVYAQVKNPGYKAINGQDVEPDCSLKNYKIYYYPPSAAKVELVKDAGYGEDLTRVSGAKPQLPLCWVDNTTFLYPNFSQGKNYVAIMKVNVTTRQQEKIGEIDQLPASTAPCRFITDGEGNTIFHCSRGYYKADARKKTVTALTFFAAGNNFEIAVSETAGKGRAVRYKGEAIGSYFCDPEKAKTTAGAIAFTNELVMGDEHYLQGVMVWTALTGKWKSIDNSDIAAVVGWTEE